jgi:hypothetical protein
MNASFVESTGTGDCVVLFSGNRVYGAALMSRG